MGSLWGWNDIMWRRYPPPGWPFPDETRVPRRSPFTCLFLIIAFCLLLIAAPSIWLFLFPSAGVGTLTVGDCFSGWDTVPADVRTQVTRVRVVDCAAPHESELLDRLEYLYGQTASDRCSISFTDYVGLAPARSRLRLSFAYPTRDPWQQGDQLLCIASFPNGAEAGSVRDSHQ